MRNETITLHLRGDQWLATFEGPEAGRIEELFGSTTIPTPFLAAMDGHDVQLRIQAVNPDSRVVLA